MKSKRHIKLKWEEGANEDFYSNFYGQIMEYIGNAEWLVFLSTPATQNVPGSSGLLERIPLPHKGFAWLARWHDSSKTLPLLFELRRAEFVLLSFAELPDSESILAALTSGDGAPATRVLFFDDGDLIEIRQRNRI